MVRFHDERPLMSQPLTPWAHRSTLPDFTRIYRGESAWWWRPFIGSFSRLYGLGVSMRLGAYRSGLLKKKTLDGFVLSVGNLTAGGTGKTPAVMMLGKWAEAEGYRVAVLSRGYGGCYKEKVLALSDGHGPRVDSRVSGDEPVLLARNLDGVPVVLSHKRYLAGVYARQRFGSDFFILDDGFQHVALKRDLDVVLMDAGDPFGNGRLLPLGPLREPMGHLARAHVFIVTRWRENAEVARRIDMVRNRFPSAPVFFAEHKPEKVVFPNTGANYGPEYIRGKRVVAFAGIARPEVFHRTITEMGAQVVY
ncbi:MAG: tetraacyldisaccharide 4'-kinase, partial [Deltaproteobacteria bacterium]|nr:tetraacyldisaccharide 4'-kinase [Deltaproteobacteria bacterium]